jgi:ABC-type glycerol-3-phosphate transport system substrate-binding protein
VWVHNAGGFLFDKYINPTESRLNTEPVRVALQFLQDIFQVDQIAHWSGDRASFSQGKSAITLNAGPSHTQNYLRAGRAGSEIATSALLLNSNSKNPEAAWRWMKYLATTSAPDHIAITGRPPAYRKAALQYEKYLANASPWEHAWINMIASSDSYHRPVYPKDIRQALQVHVDRIVEGKGAVETELAAAHAEATARFQQAKR